MCSKMKNLHFTDVVSVERIPHQSGVIGVHPHVQIAGMGLRVSKSDAWNKQNNIMK